MNRVRSFPPIEAADAETLILGTMPGAASLAAAEYYAHPRNVFWDILGAVCGFRRDDPYPLRRTRLIAARIAVWDVLQSCTRWGSLDGSIAQDSIVVNDFTAFFAAHPGIRRVLFNGAMAQTLYRRHVAAPQPALECIRLPSTSPANAATSARAKLQAWRAALTL